MSPLVRPKLSAKYMHQPVSSEFEVSGSPNLLLPEELSPHTPGGLVSGTYPSSRSCLLSPTTPSGEVFTGPCYQGIALPLTLSVMFPPLDTIYAPQTLHRLDQGVDNDAISSDQELGDSDNELEPCRSETKQTHETDQPKYEFVEEMKPKYKHDKSVCLLCVVKYAPNRSQILRNRKISASSIHRTRTETESSYGGGVGNEGESPILVPWPQTKTPALTETTPASGESMATSHDNAAFGFAKALMDSSSQSRSSVRKELLRLVELMANPILFRTSKQGLLTIKQSCKDLFQDVCVYSDVCNILATCNHKLQARRFLQDLFIDSTFNELQEEPKSILSLSPACSMETDDPTLAPPNTSGNTDSQRRDTPTSCDTDLESNTKAIIGGNYKTTTHDLGGGGCSGGGGSELSVILEGDVGGGGGGCESATSSCNTACGRLGGFCPETSSRSGGLCRKTFESGGFCGASSQAEGFFRGGKPSRATEADSRSASTSCSRSVTVCQRKQAGCEVTTLLESDSVELGYSRTGETEEKKVQECEEVWCPETRSDLILESCSGVYTSDSIDELSDETLFLKPCSSRLTLPLSSRGSTVDVTHDPLSQSSERNSSAPSLTTRSHNEAIVGDSPLSSNSNASGTYLNTSTCCSNVDNMAQNVSNSESMAPQCLDQTIASSRRVTSAYIAAHTPPKLPTPATSFPRGVPSSGQNISPHDPPVTSCSQPMTTDQGIPSSPCSTSHTSHHSPVRSGSQPLTHPGPSHMLSDSGSQSTDSNPSHPIQDSYSLQTSQSASINPSLPSGQNLTPSSGLNSDLPSLAHRIVPNIPSCTQSISFTLDESSNVNSSRLNKGESGSISYRTTCIDSSNKSSKLDSSSLSSSKLTIDKSTDVSFRLSCEKRVKSSCPEEMSQSSEPIIVCDSKSDLSKSSNYNDPETKHHHQKFKDNAENSHEYSTVVASSLNKDAGENHCEDLASCLTRLNCSSSPRLEITVENERLIRPTEVQHAKVDPLLGSPQDRIEGVRPNAKSESKDSERSNENTRNSDKTTKDSGKNSENDKKCEDSNVSPTRISVEVVIEQIPRDVEDRGKITNETEKPENKQNSEKTIKNEIETVINIEEKLVTQKISKSISKENNKTNPIGSVVKEVGGERNISNPSEQVHEKIVRANTIRLGENEDTVKIKVEPIKVTEEVVQTNVITPIECSSPSHSTKYKSKLDKTEIHTNRSPKKDTKVIDLAKVKANKNNISNLGSKPNEASKGSGSKNSVGSKLPLVKPVKTDTNSIDVKEHKIGPSESKTKSTKNNVSLSSQSKSSSNKDHGDEKLGKSTDDKKTLSNWSETSTKSCEEIKPNSQRKQSTGKNPEGQSIGSCASEQNTCGEIKSIISKPKPTLGNEKVSVLGSKKCSDPSETSNQSSEGSVLTSKTATKQSTDKKTLKIDLSARKSLPTTCSSDLMTKSRVITARKSLPLSNEMSSAKTAVKPMSLLKSNGIEEECRIGGKQTSIPQHSRK
ncbi:hypothetical protein WDU94_005088, partial [Cyamophila willieti]